MKSLRTLLFLLLAFFCVSASPCVFGETVSAPAPALKSDTLRDPLLDLANETIAENNSDAVAETQQAAQPAKKKVSLPKILKDLGKGFLVSVAIFFLTLFFALPLGLLIAFGRMSKFAPVNWLFRLYISVMRGTPLMLQLLVWYFAPYYIFGVNLGKLSFCGIEFRFTAVIIGFSLNYAAYFAEIYRAGIEAIPRGQYEAASVLGYTKSQTFLRIVLPQVIKRIIPPVTNETITLVKDTSLAFSLSVLEMFTVAKQIASAQTTMIPFVVAGVFYYIFNFIVAFGMEQLEKKLNYYR